MKTLRIFLRLFIAVSIIISSDLKAQIQTLDEFRSELESHWDLRDNNYQAYAHEELEKFLSDKCREGYHPLDLIKALELRLFTKEAAQEYRELIESLKTYKTPADEVNGQIKSFVDKHFRSSLSTSLVVTGITYYIYRNQCDTVDLFIDSKPILNPVSANRFGPVVSEQNDLLPKPVQDYLVIDFPREDSGHLSLENQKSLDGSVLQMATMMPPGLTITMELSGLVVTMFPVERFVKLAERVKSTLR